MARINNGHFGSYQGKIGAVTGRKRKGVFYISQSITHNGSNTKAQQRARLDFGTVASIIAPFAAPIAAGFAHSMRGQDTEMNAALRTNYQVYKNHSNTLRPEDIVLAEGHYGLLDQPEATCQTRGTISFTWLKGVDTNDPNDNRSVDDQCYFVFYNPIDKKVVYSVRKRGEENGTTGYPAMWTGQDVECYCFVVSKDKKQISPSDHYTVVTVL